MIKNAGGVVTNPFGSVIRSLLVGIIELGVTEVLVIGHTDCGVQHIDSEMMIHHMKNRGISQESIDLMKYCGIDFEPSADSKGCQNQRFRHQYRDWRAHADLLIYKNLCFLLRIHSFFPENSMLS